MSFPELKTNVDEPEVGVWERLDRAIDNYFRLPYVSGVPNCWRCNDTGFRSFNQERICSCESGMYYGELRTGTPAVRRNV